MSYNELKSFEGKFICLNRESRGERTYMVVEGVLKQLSFINLCGSYILFDEENAILTKKNGFVCSDIGFSDYDIKEITREEFFDKIEEAKKFIDNYFNEAFVFPKDVEEKDDIVYVRLGSWNDGFYQLLTNSNKELLVRFDASKNCVDTDYLTFNADPKEFIEYLDEKITLDTIFEKSTYFEHLSKHYGEGDIKLIISKKIAKGLLGKDHVL